MPTLSQELKKISRELKSFLQTPGDAAKQQMKSVFKVIALRFGSDLLPKQVQSLNAAEKLWLRQQIEQILGAFLTDASVAEDIRIFFYVRLTALSMSIGKQLSSEAKPFTLRDGTVTSRSEREIYDSHLETIKRQKTQKTKPSWTTIASNSALAVHAGFFVYSAVGTTSTAAFVGFWATLLSTMGTALVWLVDQSRSLLSKINLAGSPALLPLKIVGIALYAIIMAPFILRTLYKNLRNIISAKYAEKRRDSIARLSSSLLLAGAGVALGLVAGMFGWGGGPLVALGLGALGWGIGHSIYKWYKRRRDARIHFGKSNPQASRFTYAQLEAVLAKVPAAKPIVRAGSAPTQEDTNVAQNKVMNNLVNLVQRLENIISEEKQSRRAYRSFSAFGLALIKALWGFHFRTPREHTAKEALRDLKRGNWNMLQARCGIDSNGLGIRLDENFTMGEAEVGVVAASAPTSDLWVGTTSEGGSQNLSVGSASSRAYAGFWVGLAATAAAGHSAEAYPPPALPARTSTTVGFGGFVEGATAPFPLPAAAPAPAERGEDPMASQGDTPDKTASAGRGLDVGASAAYPSAAYTYRPGAY